MEWCRKASRNGRRRSASAWDWAREAATCFLFFQAEDGIRDYKVTGVQTCALPISSMISSRISYTSCDSFSTIFLARFTVSAMPFSTSWWMMNGLNSSTAIALGRPHWRSEERRVGKECRSRWSPYHLKKKHYHQH